MSDLAFAVGDNIAVSDNIVDLTVLVTGTEYRSLKKIQNHFIKKMKHRMYRGTSHNAMVAVWTPTWRSNARSRLRRW